MTTCKVSNIPIGDVVFDDKDNNNVVAKRRKSALASSSSSSIKVPGTDEQQVAETTFA